jgi:hypothetical protein
MVYSLNRLFSSSFFAHAEYFRSGSMLKPDQPKMSRRIVILFDTQWMDVYVVLLTCVQNW